MQLRQPKNRVKVTQVFLQCSVLLTYKCVFWGLVAKWWLNPCGQCILGITDPPGQWVLGSSDSLWDPVTPPIYKRWIQWPPPGSKVKMITIYALLIPRQRWLFGSVSGVVLFQLVEPLVKNYDNTLSASLSLRHSRSTPHAFWVWLSHAKTTLAKVLEHKVRFSHCRDGVTFWPQGLNTNNCKSKKH